MILRLRIQNFRSIRDSEEISFVATRLSGLQEAIELDASGVSVLRSVAVYGPNASGKTNVMRAVAFMVDAVENSHRVWKPDAPIPVTPFLLDTASRERPSEFEVDLMLNSIRYRYGFAVTRAAVEREWLFSYPEGRQRLVFERDASSSEVRFGRSLRKRGRAITDVLRPNSLVVSAGAQFNVEEFAPVYEWFSNKVRTVTGSKRALTTWAANFCEIEEGKEVMRRVLRAADLGITDVSSTQTEVDQKFKDAFLAYLHASGGSPGRAQEFLEAMRDPVLLHRSADGSPVALAWEDESEGTKTLFALMGALIPTIGDGGLLCIDELDASLHPLLARRLVRMFYSSETEGSQLLFNTHDAQLLDSGVLRRDQVWFAEKDDAGATHIYPLSDFQPRPHEQLGKGYLMGRYGAIPFLGDWTLGDVELEASGIA